MAALTELERLDLNGERRPPSTQRAIRPLTNLRSRKGGGEATEARRVPASRRQERSAIGPG